MDEPPRTPVLSHGQAGASVVVADVDHQAELGKLVGDLLDFGLLHRISFGEFILDEPVALAAGRRRNYPTDTTSKNRNAATLVNPSPLKARAFTHHHA
ncbi:hypothetical protein AB0891_29955 [Streptomyces sp. NPDC007259]|uniref:hypothetical protein n=1 Tax=Streptomyces sp. NPDC007259 TaxID=3154319 RepID=UPI0034531DC0